MIQDRGTSLVRIPHSPHGPLQGFRCRHATGSKGDAPPCKQGNPKARGFRIPALTQPEIGGCGERDKAGERSMVSRFHKLARAPDFEVKALVP